MKEGMYMSTFETIMVFGLFIFGLLAIIKSGDLFVEASAWIAKISGIPQFVIGATIVSLATTLPELMVSAIASAQGNNQMAVGNAVGSVTANTGLIMALSIIFLPHAVNLQRFAPKAIILMGSIFFLAIFSLTGGLNIVGTVGMFIIFAIFIIQNLHDAKQSVSQGQISAQDMRIAVSRRDIVRHIVYFVVGTAGIVIGSNLLVDNGTLIADKIFMVDRRIISLTAVAIGTSLPELVTTVTAIAKKQSSLSIGNIMGANIIDLTLIMPVCSIICGGTLKISKSTLLIDLPFLALITLAVFIPVFKNRRFSRSQGFLAIALYAIYMMFL